MNQLRQKIRDLGNIFRRQLGQFQQKGMLGFFPSPQDRNNRQAARNLADRGMRSCFKIQDCFNQLVNALTVEQLEQIQHAIENNQIYEGSIKKLTKKLIVVIGLIIGIRQLLKRYYPILLPYVNFAALGGFALVAAIWNYNVQIDHNREKVRRYLSNEPLIIRLQQLANSVQL